MNVRVEKNAEGRLQGMIRIRCKTEPMAVCLGDKVRQIQKKMP